MSAVSSQTAHGGGKSTPDMLLVGIGCNRGIQRVTDCNAGSRRDDPPNMLARIRNRIPYSRRYRRLTGG